jgi:hypothetical protein
MLSDTPETIGAPNPFGENFPRGRVVFHDGNADAHFSFHLTSNLQRVSS